MQQQLSTRVAWLFSAMGTGGISFQHLLCEFAQVFPNTITFTGQWPGYAPGFENTFAVQEVGASRYIGFNQVKNGYTVGFSYASPQIINHLLKFKPQVVFANAFTMWTAIALLLKPIGRWKVIIIYEGGSLTYEDSKSTVRYQARRLMVRFADSFIVNSQSGKSYLLNVLQIKPEKVFTRPFLVPSLKAMQHFSEAETACLEGNLKKPVFLFVGQIIPRKGLQKLLEACLLLKKQGYSDYTLMIVGDGDQRLELEAFVKDAELDQQIVWIGKVTYQFLGAYFQLADVFVFPTYDDIWGMVLTEAMGFGKAVLCSKSAGAVEMVTNAENGFIFDPDNPQELMHLMRQFIDTPNLISSMGEKSKEIMSQHTPAEAVKCFIEVVHAEDKSIDANRA